MNAPLPQGAGRPRVLITRLSAIGDCLLTLPMLCAVRREFPQARIAWLTQASTAPLLNDHPCLDEVMQINRRWMRSPTEAWRITQQLREFAADVVLDPQGLLKSTLPGWLSGAAIRCGFAPPLGRELTHWFNNRICRPRSEHIVDQHLELLATIGITTTRVEFRLPQFEVAAEFAQQILRDVNLHQGFCLLNPAAGWESRRWPPERFGQVARELGQWGLPSLVVWGSEYERLWAETVVANSAGAARLAPATHLCTLAELTRRATFCLSGDTGPLHLAVALGVPCVGVFGGTDPQKCGPYGPIHRVARAAVLPPRNQRKTDTDAILSVTTSQVIAQCRELLETSGQHRQAS